MKIVHTSDWHIGQMLCARKRHEEFEAFLAWLAALIDREQIDVLLVAGDVFDTPLPGNRAQALYYGFLSRVAHSCCRHVVVIGGNHDSPSFLNAPKELLRALHVHVVGAASGDPAEEVLLLRQPDGRPELIVCAIPYLRDRDIRLAEAGESIEEKEQKIQEGIRRHYAAVAKLAVEQRQSLGVSIPIVAMGHLFTAGGQTVDGDGVRELYIGSLAHLPAAQLPTAWDYLALGHLHVPQKVGGSEWVRYSGSPLPMGFGEAKQQKSLCLLTCIEAGIAVTLYPVPVFQPLESVRGSWPMIVERLRALVAAGSRAWLEVIYEGEERLTDLRERLEPLVSGSAMEILRIKNSALYTQALCQQQADETLNDLDLYEVFDRCLAAHGIPAAQQIVMRHTYQEAVTALQEADSQAE
ncbi:MAG: exonuclease SbcCD subunit D C-terminal domain-containing protein [Magnetococcales bacterium]|nr:exonuclease SbcCD subunit D C-terminal domain-containing protein [Magnetococcales bacterium]